MYDKVPTWKLRTIIFESVQASLLQHFNTQSANSQGSAYQSKLASPTYNTLWKINANRNISLILSQILIAQSHPWPLAFALGRRRSNTTHSCTNVRAQLPHLFGSLRTNLPPPSYPSLDITPTTLQDSASRALEPLNNQSLLESRPTTQHGPDLQSKNHAVLHLTSLAIAKPDHTINKGVTPHGQMRQILEFTALVYVHHIALTNRSFLIMFVITTSRHDDLAGSANPHDRSSHIKSPRTSTRTAFIFSIWNPMIKKDNPQYQILYTRDESKNFFTSNS